MEVWCPYGTASLGSSAGVELGRDLAVPDLNDAGDQVQGNWPVRGEPDRSLPDGIRL
jgi:hypothetical protein